MICNSPHSLLTDVTDFILLNDTLPKRIDHPFVKPTSISVMELFNLLNNCSDFDEIDNILTLLLHEIPNVNNNIPTHYFESFVSILGEPQIFHQTTIHKVFQMIYELLTIKNKRSKEYLKYFSQPLFLEYYFTFFGFPYSVRTLTFLIKKQNYMADELNDMIHLKLNEAEISDFLIEFLSCLISINYINLPIESILQKINEIIKNSCDSSNFCASIEFMKIILLKYPSVSEQLAVNIKDYLKNVNIFQDDVDCIHLLQLFAKLAKIVKRCDFLANNEFINLVTYIFNLYQEKSTVLSELLLLLKIDIDVTSFLQFPNLIELFIHKLEILPFRDQKNLMHFLVNLLLVGNIEALRKSVELGISKYISLFLDTENDRKFIIKLLKFIFLCQKCNIYPDLKEEIESFILHTDSEISLLASMIINGAEAS
ncbi:hypothetical protein TRFO_12422 [Tritrichomonas foetus]|uniref:SPIN90/Ldb17 leucine-rich domain-containing protein n=1 Tax=Tritrichomonas foetus TaxID=1144522 RepID=A0A1J4L1Y0_9EUKA|nr:hypothetical protein TRFO_12422 [Tritrichomonas foetus]|eukprot:OHT17451.1 hypothetical protein TRFO_12422 [Tritrichomonas foetus]